MSESIGRTSYEIDIEGDALDYLQMWNREMKESRAGNAAFAGSFEDLEKEMGEYAQKIGLTAQQLEQLKKVSVQNKLDADFAQKYGFAYEEVKKVRGEMENVRKRTDDSSGAAGKLGAAFTAVASIQIGNKFLEFGKEIAGQAAEYETLSISMEVMLGSAEKAKQVLGDLDKFSNRTPYDPKKVQDSGKSLLAFGLDAGSLIPTLQMIGDVASGTGMDINELSQIFGKNMTQGVVQTEDLMQLAGRGIPIFDEMAKVMGITSGQVKGLASTGAIKFEHLQKVFANMTGEGGKYFDMMKKQSESAAGLASTLDGNVNQIRRSMGEFILAGLKPVTTYLISFSSWVMKNETALKILKVAMVIMVPVIGVLLVGALLAAAAASWTFIAPWLPFILIAVAVIAQIMMIILIIEDLYSFFTGGESVFGDFLGKFKGVWEKVKTFFAAAIDAIIGFAKKYGKYIIMFLFPISAVYFYWDQIKAFFFTAVDMIISLAKKYGKYVIMFLFPVSAVYFYWDQIKSFFSIAVNTLIDLAKKYGKFVIMALFPLSALYFFWDQISEFFRSIPDRIAAFFAPIGGKVAAYFKAIPTMIGDLIESIPGRMKDSLASLQGFVLEMLRDVLPGKLFKLVLKASGMNLEGRAKGGGVNAGTPYEVGENGREVFVPESDGSIIPHHELGRSRSGGITINISPIINISGSVKESVSEITQLIQDAIEDGLRSVRNDLGLEAYE